LSRKSKYITGIIIFLISITVYWSGTYPTITWWESSEYSAAASCLGITGAPGSIFLTLLGWIVSKFSSHPAFLFNLLAGAIASLAILLCFMVAQKLPRLFQRNLNVDFSPIKNVLVAAASGIVICSATPWEYAIVFAPYILTALFTMIILLTVLNWWENAEKTGSWKGIFLITLFIGLDFSVHRTNAILIPGILILMLIRNYRIFLNYRSYLAAFSGILLGGSVQLLYIPMSWLDPALNLGETNNFSSWWDFISLKQYGGSFLTDIFIRKGPLWSYQIPYYWKGFAHNFFYFDPSTLILGFVPALLGTTGIVHILRKNRKLGLALVLLFLVSIASSIIYFNLPENYFRTVYRHFLPTFFIFGVFIFTGTGALMEYLSRIPGKTTKWLAISGLLILIPGTAFVRFFSNKSMLDGSGRTFTVDHAHNIVGSVGKNGILFSYADNHYFPELYLQIAEKVRPDIDHCNLSLLNLEWYVQQKKRHDPAFPFRGSEVNLKQFLYENWKPISCELAVPDSLSMKYPGALKTIPLTLSALRENNTNLLQDLVLFDIIRNNQWGRPLYFVKQYMDPALNNWLKPWLSDEGLVYRLIPDSTMKTNGPAILKNLATFRVNGYSDNAVTLDNESKETGKLYYDLFLTVVKEKIKEGNWSEAFDYLSRMKEILPFQRLTPDQEIQNENNALEEMINSEINK
jgi:hypothetical protein